MGKLLFFDIDGTLQWPGDPVSPVVVEALDRAQKNGHKLFICTGRGEKRTRPALDVDRFDGAIYQAGRLVVAENRILHEEVVPEAFWKETIERIRDLTLVYSLDCSHEMFQSGHFGDPGLPMPKGLTPGLFQIIGGGDSALLTEYRGESVHKMTCVCSHMDQVREIARRMEGMAKVMSYESFMGDIPAIYVDICFGEANKAVGMDAICAYYGKSREDCIAFGDGENDLEIMKAAGIGVAMGNADPAVIEAADRVCEHCQEDGIAKELERMGLC